MNKIFYLFCKTYSGDLRRFQKLLKSIALHNKDNITTYVSVPRKDRSLFEALLPQNSSFDIIFIDDEDVISEMPEHDLEKYKKASGYISQQVVKSEFWRFFDYINNEIIYLCMDADSFFIRDFYLSDFLNSNGVPYTVIHQNKELLQLAQNKKIIKILHNFNNENKLIKNIFSRVGPNYEYGGTPVIWSSKVWLDLYVNFLEPSNMTFWDALDLMPSELRWYGEALLKYKSIPLHPIEPIFRIYHYDWQYIHSVKNNESVASLNDLYLGVIVQSNWNYEMDFGDQAMRKGVCSKLLRSLKRYFARFR